MSRLNRTTYQQLVDENLRWLLTMPRTLERDHVAEIVRDSVRHLYEEDPRDTEIATLRRDLAATQQEADRLREGIKALTAEVVDAAVVAGNITLAALVVRLRALLGTPHQTTEGESTDG